MLYCKAKHKNEEYKEEGGNYFQPCGYRLRTLGSENIPLKIAPRGIKGGKERGEGRDGRSWDTGNEVN